MRNILVVFFAIFLFPSLSLAGDEENRGKNVEQVKSHILKKMDKKISILNSFKSCVSSANSHDAIKSCRQQKKESMKAIKKENKETRKHFRDEHKKRKGERKNKRKDNDNDDD